jgi:hypothetical protein
VIAPPDVVAMIQWLIVDALGQSRRAQRDMSQEE